MSNVNVCDDQWHALPDDKFTWVNNGDKECNVTPHSHKTWPFADPSYHVPAKRTLPGHVRPDLPNGTYTYDVDCCPRTNPRNVLVP